MNPTISWRVALAAALSFTLAACGGGGADGGTGGTGVSSGTVTGFGSIFVNGVKFSTGSATFRRDDNPSSESELKIGMNVEVRGSISSSTNGTATLVEVEEAVRGSLEAAPLGTPAAGATMVILGQTVRVDETTLIDNNVCDTGELCTTLAQRLAAMDTGDIFEVHGARNSDGSIGATFIERKSPPPVLFSVRGQVNNHDHATRTFGVGALIVNYGVIGTIIGDMPAPSGNNWNTLFVEVKGNTCTGSPVCGTLTAAKVEPEGLGVAEATQAEYEGFVTDFTSSSSFRVGTVPVVTIDGFTSFLGGDKNEIARGVKLEVEGTLAAGVLTATKVKFKDSVKIESNATATATQITVAGLPGITVTANAFTEVFGSGTTATRTDLSPLNGRNVRIRGRASGTNSVIATEIEDRGSANNDVRLQGFATNASNPTFAILGVPVITSSLSEANFKGTNDQQIGSAAFYSAITPNGGLVKARGQLPAPNALTGAALKEVELED